ncbi:hypothetical protein ACFSX9_10515 [Flavobacterium ardleyense]|uniref:WG containing repeat-containing protein n=1 Tax=Flavobacterium ardleyense TaxID=2038737 RepID=A0ABW5Z8G6_9FLAO
MKKYLFLLLITCFSAFGQEMYVPYKIGNKYAISDYNGVLKTEAVYDSLDVNSNQNEILNFKRDTLSGLVYQLKEIVIGNDYIDYYLKKEYILAKYNTKEYFPYHNFFNLYGKKMLSDSYYHLEFFKYCENCLFHIVKAQYYEKGVKKYDLYIYNSKKQDLESISITNVDDVSVPYLSDFTSKIIKVTKANKINYYEIAKNQDKVVLQDASAKKKELNSQSMIIERSTYNEDNEEVYHYSFHTYKFTAIKVKENKYFLETSMGRKKDTTEISLSKKAKDLKIVDYKFDYYFGKKPTGVFNYLEYKINNNIGYYFTDSIYMSPEKYYSVAFFNSNLSTKNTISQSYIYGIKDKKTKKIKYGVNDLFGTEIIKPLYDRIKINFTDNNSQQKLFKNIENYFIVYKDAKFGFLTTTGEEALPIKYDTYYKNEYKSKQYDSKFSILRHGENYSIFNIYGLNNFQYSKYEFKYKPKFYISHFYDVKEHILFGLFNEANEFLGYANENGVYFFKE